MIHMLKKHTHTHIHVWGGFRGIGDLAAKLGTWILPHFHGVYSYDVPRNIAISRPKKCKKQLHNRYDFLPVTGEKIELSNNARGHPIACILPLDCLTSDFWIWGYPHCFWIPHLPEMICVCVPENPPIHTHTHTYTYEVVFGESEIWQRNWGHEFYPTFTVCIHTMSPETLQ